MVGASIGVKEMMKMKEGEEGGEEEVEKKA